MALEVVGGMETYMEISRYSTYLHILTHQAFGIGKVIYWVLPFLMDE